MEQGYEVVMAPNGKVAITLLDDKPFQLIISDILMPEINGIHFVKYIREQQMELPVLFISALGQRDDKLRGFDAGGDDYLLKPFDFDELLVRVKALLKRNKPESQREQLMTYADLQLDPDKKTVSRGGKTISFTAKEFSLLQYFMKHREKYITREELAREVWKVDFNTGTNFVEVYVSYIRNKLEKDFSTKLIHSRKGFGYLLKAEPDDENSN